MGYVDLPVLCRLCGGGRIENKGLRLEKAFAASSGSRAGSCMGSHNRPSDGVDLSDMAEFSHAKGLKKYGKQIQNEE